MPPARKGLGERQHTSRNGAFGLQPERGEHCDTHEPSITRLPLQKGVGSQESGFGNEACFSSAIVADRVNTARNRQGGVRSALFDFASVLYERRANKSRANGRGFCLLLRIAMPVFPPCYCSPVALKGQLELVHRPVAVGYVSLDSKHRIGLIVHVFAEAKGCFIAVLL